MRSRSAMPKRLTAPEIRAATELPQTDVGPDNTVNLQDHHEPLRAPLSESARLRGLTWEQLRAAIGHEK
jgi:hypothetical protein